MNPTFCATYVVVGEGMEPIMTGEEMKYNDSILFSARTSTVNHPHQQIKYHSDAFGLGNRTIVHHMLRLHYYCCPPSSSSTNRSDPPP
jgi:hypothetical protein